MIQQTDLASLSIPARIRAIPARGAERHQWYIIEFSAPEAERYAEAVGALAEQRGATVHYVIQDSIYLNEPVTMPLRVRRFLLLGWAAWAFACIPWAAYFVATASRHYLAHGPGPLGWLALAILHCVLALVLEKTSRKYPAQAATIDFNSGQEMA